MKFKNYNDEIKYLIKIVKQASKKIEKMKINVSVKNASSHDLVTNADFETEKFLTEKMKEKFPNFDVVSEELNPNGVMTENCFTIDPIDGTVNFANGLPIWSIQIALIKNNENIASVIYLPSTDDLYYAVCGEGAYYKGKRIFVNQTPAKSCLYTLVGTRKKFDVLQTTSKFNYNFRELGALSVAFAYLSEGFLGALAFFKYTRWDIEPGRLISKEAGAEILDIPNKGIIVANNKENLNEFVNEIFKVWDTNINK